MKMQECCDAVKQDYGHGGRSHSTDTEKKKQCNWWCAACDGQYDCRNPKRFSVIQKSTDRREAMVFRGHAPPTGVCENLLDLQERSKLKMREELKRFITVDNHGAMKISDLERTLASLLLVEAKFSKEDCPHAAVRQGAELTLRKGEEGGLRTFIDTTDVGDSRCGPPLLGEDWHATCQA